MEIEVIRSSRRTLGLEVKPDGRVICRAPRWATQGQIRRFAEENRDWIQRQLQKIQRLRERVPGIEPFTEEELKRLVEIARRQITARVEHYAPQVGVSYGRIAIRKQHTKWGSCSSKGNLNFNCLLALAPAEVLDYVVVHELCHRLEMNHSASFWAQVRRVLPDYERARRWLRENGAALLMRLPET